MKLYIADFGVYGCCVALASSEEEARAWMRAQPNWEENRRGRPTFLSEHPIDQPFQFCNLGDT